MFLSQETEIINVHQLIPHEKASQHPKKNPKLQFGAPKT